ncbi:MAG: penicillin-binding protein activator LpoB [Treponema sp.]|jgi:TolB-like protein|nr:penicillin-binding protein activator LpoB [Treponema sp.]
MKKAGFGIMLVIMLMAGCVGGAKTAPVQNAAGGAEAAAIQDEAGGAKDVREFRSLDLAIEQSCQNIQDDFNERASIAVFNVASSSTRLSEYIIEEVMNNFTNMHKYNVVERNRISAIFQEQEFQFSGNVSDDTIQKLGNMLGAQFVVSGSLDDVGTYYRLRLFVVAIESGERKSSTAVSIIKPNEQVSYLLGGEGNNGAAAGASALGGERNNGTVSESSARLNLVGTTWAVALSGENMGRFIFEADNVVRSSFNLASSPDREDIGQYIYVDGIWVWNQNEEKLTVRIPFSDPDELQFEFDNITNINMTGGILEDGEVVEQVELTRLR